MPAEFLFQAEFYSVLQSGCPTAPPPLQKQNITPDTDSVLSGEKFQKSLMIFPRNWELFYSSLKFVVSELTRDHNTLRAGAPASPPTANLPDLQH